MDLESRTLTAPQVVSKCRVGLWRTAPDPHAGYCPAGFQATSDPLFRRWSTSHLGGPPRRGCSARQSMDCSTLIMRVVSSVAAVFPPHTSQRRRHQAAGELAERESAGWNKIGPVGGHSVDRAVPTRAVIGIPRRTARRGPAESRTTNTRRIHRRALKVLDEKRPGAGGGCSDTPRQARSRVTRRRCARSAKRANEQHQAGHDLTCR
jgi:hypothetical protein